MNKGEDDIDFDDLLRSVRDVQSLLDESIAGVSEPDVKGLLEAYAQQLRISTDEFFAAGPTELARLKEEIAASEGKLLDEMAKTEQPAPTAATPPEPEFVADSSLGERLRDELLARHGLAPEIAPAAAPRADVANPLEPYDFWSASLSTLSGIHPAPPGKPGAHPDSTPPPASSVESWLNRDSGEYRDTNR